MGGGGTIIIRSLRIVMLEPVISRSGKVKLWHFTLAIFALGFLLGALLF